MSVILYLLSLIYGAVVRLKAFCYDAGLVSANTVPCKIISIGNITVGGTGKTTLVGYLAKYLTKQGRKTVILSRGYASYLFYDRPCLDEPTLLTEELKDTAVLVGKDRIVNAKRAVYVLGAEVLILDDAFQYRRLKNDLSIVTINCANPFGNRHLLPHGRLREPISSLKRADIFFLTKVDLAIDLARLKMELDSINPNALIVESIHKVKTTDIDSLKNKKVLLVSSIGDPASFENMARRSGMNISKHIAYPDHYQYTSRDLEDIVDTYNKTNAEVVVTTQKDWVKLSKLRNDIKFIVFKIELEIIANGQEFFNRLNRVFTN